MIKLRGEAMKLSAIYSDGMIMQRDTENIIEGVASANSEIRLYFDQNIYEGICDEEGHFSIILPPMEAGGPHTINITDKSDRYTINYVYIGDVRVCGASVSALLQIEAPSGNGAGTCTCDVSVKCGGGCTV